MRDTKPAIPPQQAPSEKKTFKRRRCQNCNKLYMPTREDQKFCRDLPDPDKCRKEFYRYGSSYGPLKTGLHKAIDKKYAALEKQMSAKLRTFALAVQVLTDDIMSLRHCQTGMPRDDSGAYDYTLIPREESQRKAAVERTLSGRRSR